MHLPTNVCGSTTLQQVLDPELTHVYRDMTLGHYLDTKGYSEAFKYNYVLPMCAAVWSVPNATVRCFEASASHCALSVSHDTSLASTC
jgi:predicted NAD/FAD-binding protein